MSANRCLYLFLAVFGDNRPERVNQLVARRLVKLSPGGRFIESHHGIEVEEPDNRLTRRKVGDDVANLDGMPVAGTASVATTDPRTRLARRSMAAPTSESAPR